MAAENQERTSLRLNCLLWLFYGGEEKQKNVESTDFWFGKYFWREVRKAGNLS